MSLTGCPACGARSQSRIVQTCENAEGTVTRVRHCEACSRVYTTYEVRAGTPPPTPLVGKRVEHAHHAAHPVVKLIMTCLIEKRVSQKSLAEAVGVHSESVSRWARGLTTPGLHDAEAALNALGYELKIERKTDG